MIGISLGVLQQKQFEWFQLVLEDVDTETKKWDSALFDAQKLVKNQNEGFLDGNNQIKVNCHIRFVRLPPPDPRYKIPFPNYSQIDEFREIKGNVVRMSQMKLLELKRDFICSQCKATTTIEADYSLMYRFDVPRNCENSGCKGTIHQKNAEPLPHYCAYYQELKVQVIFQ